MSDLIDLIEKAAILRMSDEWASDIFRKAAVRIKELETTKSALTEELAKLTVECSVQQVRAERAEAERDALN